MHSDGVVVGIIEFQCRLNLSLKPACGDLTGINWIKKEQGCVSPRLM